MCSTKPKISKKIDTEIISFIPPRRHDGKSSFIDFFIVDPSTGKLKRKKYMLDRFQKGRERDFMAAQIVANIYNKVQQGWNPWVAFPTMRSDIAVKKVLERYRIYINKLTEKKSMAEKTRTDYFSRMRVLEEYLEDRSGENMKMYQFNITCMSDFLDYILLDRDASTKTRNNYRTWLSAFCTWLVSKQYIKHNEVEDIPVLAERVKFREALPIPELKRLSSYLQLHDKKMLLACMMEYYTFIRPTELTKIRIWDISIEKQTVFVSAAISKNRKDGMVALNDKVLKLMIELGVFSHPGKHYLFGKNLSPAEERAESRVFRDRFVQIRRDLGFPDSYQFYSLKDSGIRDLANAEGIVVARDQARHSDVSVTNKYLVGRNIPVHEDTKHFEGAL